MLMLKYLYPSVQVRKRVRNVLLFVPCLNKFQMKVTSSFSKRHNMNHMLCRHCVGQYNS